MKLDVDNTASIRWQQVGVMFASSEHERASMTTSTYSHVAAYDHYDAVFDNASNLCSDDLSFHCPGGQTVMMIALRWAKIFILKVARTYYAGPICLMILPLLVGGMIGYILGIRSHTHTFKNSSGPKSSRSLCLRSLTNILWSFFAASTSIKSLILHYFCAILQHCPWFLSNDHSVVVREEQVRVNLRSDAEMRRESAVDLSLIPRHVAVIMDGNRRYGKKHHPDNPTQGHWDGSETLVRFCKWCIAEKIQILTVYAFSTENWNRSADEVAELMTIFTKYCDELRIEALERNIRIRVLSTEVNRIPSHVKAGIQRMVDETAHCEGGLSLNICLSYGSRGEIVHACRQVAIEVLRGEKSVEDITDDSFQHHLLLPSDPDVVIRTSGEQRISNFLLWQMAYSELFFLKKTWPEMEKRDLVDIIQSYASERERRFGK